MLNVIFVAYDRNSSGIASYTLELARLASEIFNVSIISFDALDGIDGIHVIDVPRPPFPAYLPLLNARAANGRITSIIKAADPDIVHETLPPLAWNVENLVTTQWGYVSYFKLAMIRTFLMQFPYNVGGIPVTFQHWLGDRKSFERARRRICISRMNENFMPPSIRVRPLKKNTEDNELKLLFVARDINIRRKNLSVILRAVKILRRNFTLHVVGKGYAEGEHIVCHGSLSNTEVIGLMNECDALVLPSLYEELGYVGLEAYSVGLPVIASDIPSFKIVFSRSLFFSPANHIELARLLESVSTEELRNIGIESRQFRIQTREYVRDRLQQIYESIITH